MIGFKAPSPATRVFLRLFLVSVAACAVMGAVMIALPTTDWSWRLKVWLTTVIVAGASVCGLACGGCFALGHRLLPTAGIVLSLAAASMGLVGMWSELAEVFYWRVVVAATALGVGCSHVSMLMMAQLRGVYRWAHVASYQVILGLAALVAAGSFFSFYESAAYWRLIGVLSVASAALTLAVPVFHVLSRRVTAMHELSGDVLLRVDEQIAFHKKQLMDLQAERQRLLQENSDER